MSTTYTEKPIEGPSAEHYFSMSVRESTIACSKLSEGDLKRVQGWVESESLEYEVFSAFDCGPGPNGPDVNGCCDAMGIDKSSVSASGEVRKYKEGAFYCQTVELYSGTDLHVVVTLPEGVPFDASKFIVKHDPDHTDVVAEIQYPEGSVDWNMESPSQCDSREWYFYKCVDGVLEWVEIGDELSELFGAEDATPE